MEIDILNLLLYYKLYHFFGCDEWSHHHRSLVIHPQVSLYYIHSMQYTAYDINKSPNDDDDKKKKKNIIIITKQQHTTHTHTPHNTYE